VDHSLGNTLMVEAVDLRMSISMRGTNAGKVYLGSQDTFSRAN
jgi:hypothetical protein